MNDNKIQYIDLRFLKFDPTNPRLPSFIKNSSVKETIDWMLLDTSLLDLISSIAQNGFFHGEPLIVVASKNADNDYFVIEGNRRLAACLILNKPSISKTKSKAIKDILDETNNSIIPSSIPCIVFSSRELVIDYLGYRHITGVESWGPLSKARYLDLLFSRIGRKETLEKKCKSLAKKIGSKGSFVKRLLVGYWLYQLLEEDGFYKIRGLEEDKIEFSRLYDSLRFKGLSEFLSIDLEKTKPLENVSKKNLEELCIWIYEKNEGQTRLGDSRNLKILDKVVQSEEALKAFRAGKTLNESSNYSGLPEEMFSENIFKSFNYIQEAVNVSARTNKVTDIDLTNIKQIIKFSEMLYRTFRKDE